MRWCTTRLLDDHLFCWGVKRSLCPGKTRGRMTTAKQLRRKPIGVFRITRLVASAPQAPCLALMPASRSLPRNDLMFGFLDSPNALQRYLYYFRSGVFYLFACFRLILIEILNKKF